MLWPPKSDCHWRWVQVWTHCLPPSRGALQPAASRAMRVRATRAFHTTLPDKITLPFIIVLIVMPPVYLCRRTPFMMISSLHVTKVMMLIMIMTTRPEIRDQRPETRDQRPQTRDTSAQLVFSFHLLILSAQLISSAHLVFPARMFLSAVCLCRRTPFILTFGVKLVCLKSREFYCAIRVSYWDNYLKPYGLAGPTKGPT